MYYKALRPPPTAQHGVVTVRTQILTGSQASSATVKWHVDKLNVSNVNRLTGSVHPRMREFSYAH